MAAVKLAVLGFGKIACDQHFTRIPGNHNFVLTDGRETPIKVEFDFLLTDEQVVDRGDRKYAGLYHRFAELIRRGEQDIDLSPLQFVADTLMLGRRVQVEPFNA